MEKRKVPFQALGGCFEQDDVDAAMKVIQAVADGGDFFPLPEENDFQNALAKHEGSKKAVAVNSCGTALDLCMMTLGIGPGDEVIVPGLTFVCTATCAAARGATLEWAGAATLLRHRRLDGVTHGRADAAHPAQLRAARRAG